MIDKNKIRESIREKIMKDGIASIAVAVAKGDEILLEEGFGWANREKMIPSNPNIMYSLASISKPITATALMILKERGLIDLDRPVNDYLDDAKLTAWIGKAEDATVRMIANHTSGLAVHCHFFYEDENYPKPSMDETIRRYGNIVSIPGERYQYCNLGYGILDYIISRLSGKSYADFMREEVFLPLDMTRSSINIDKGLRKYQAIRYGTDKKIVPFYDFDHPGGSAVFSSVHDLVRFGMFHLKAHLPNQRAILSDESIDEMQVGTADMGNGNRYGIGWATCQNSYGYRVSWHNGLMGGVNTTLMLVPDEKIVVTVLANSNTNQHEIICREILSAMLPKYAENLAIAEAKKKSNTDQTAMEFIPTSELIGEWNGEIVTYKEHIPITFWFKESGDVVVKIGDQLKTLLNDVVFRDGYLFGRMIGDIKTEDANRHPYHLHITMKLRDKVLNGSITAITHPKDRFGNALSHWIEIIKK
ncbi:TPA: class A beta-lactamase-related serine hydrolase [Candidatus Poribacteria bacterium]|nr:class A beta-lactamase-related serine hydrolase [Candidatus Poribacteria bacterium]